MEYRFIGWCQDEKTNADKVWAVIKLNGDHWGGAYATVWGRRGKKLQHKVIDHSNTWDIDSLIRSKTRKDYARIDESQLNEVYPDFQNDLEATAFWAMLKA